jgi:hypothetical protein
MPRISLSDFVDVVSRSGSPKATKVREIKNRSPYLPATDFYKPFRDGLVDLHRKAQGKSSLTALASPNDLKKAASYAALVDGYRKWWGRKDLVWFEPSREIYEAHGVEIVVNPTLGLAVNGVPHLIRLHLKADKLTKMRADLIGALMLSTLETASPGAAMAVLDVRNSKLFAAGNGPDGVDAMVNAELAYIASLWPKV